MSDWFDAESQMTAEVTREFGRPCVRYIPMRKPPTGRTAIDPTRDQYDLTGVLDWPWDRAEVKPFESTESSRRPTLLVHQGCFRYPARKDDVVVVPYRGERLQFVIADIRKDGESGVVLDLTQAGAQV